MTKSFIPYSTQSINADDVKSVVKVLNSRFLTQGPVVLEFEKALARYVGAKYCVSFSNGTAALFAACASCGMGRGDEVIVPTLSFVASANCVIYCGTKPVLVDIYNDSLTINAEEVITKINKKTRAIIAVDFAGHSADWAELRKIARKHNLVLIDDASHAIGSKYEGKKIGSIADLTIFSFHPVKTITSGEGGAVTTNNKNFYDKLIKFRNHGMVKSKRIAKANGEWFYQIESLGFNFRLTDMQAALGYSQLKRINRFVKRRRELWEIYQKELKNIDGVALPSERQGSYSAWHLFTIRIDESKYGITRRRLFEKLRNKNIGVQVHYIPIHVHKLYQKLYGYKIGDFPIAEQYYKEAISIPLFPGLSRADQKRVIGVIKNTWSK